MTCSVTGKAPKGKPKFTIHQGNFSLPQTKTVTENYSQSKCRVVEPHCSGYMDKTPKAQRTMQRKEVKRF